MTAYPFPAEGLRAGDVLDVTDAPAPAGPACSTGLARVEATVRPVNVLEVA